MHPFRLQLGPFLEDPILYQVPNIQLTGCTKPLIFSNIFDEVSSKKSRANPIIFKSLTKNAKARWDDDAVGEIANLRDFLDFFPTTVSQRFSWRLLYRDSNPIGQALVFSPSIHHSLTWSSPDLKEQHQGGQQPCCRCSPGQPLSVVLMGAAWWGHWAP